MLRVLQTSGYDSVTLARTTGRHRSKLTSSSRFRIRATHLIRSRRFAVDCIRRRYATRRSFSANRGASTDDIVSSRSFIRSNLFNFFKLPRSSADSPLSKSNDLRLIELSVSAFSLYSRSITFLASRSLNVIGGLNSAMSREILG